MHIFRMPANAPKLSYGALRTYMDGRRTARIGTTVTLTDHGDSIAFRLYYTELARISEHAVEFTVHGDRHQATREWLEKIIKDNGAGFTACRPRKGYVRGYGSPLCIDGDPARPVEGRRYEVGHD